MLFSTVFSAIKSFSKPLSSVANPYLDVLSMVKLNEDNSLLHPFNNGRFYI